MGTNFGKRARITQPKITTHKEGPTLTESNVFPFINSAPKLEVTRPKIDVSSSEESIGENSHFMLDSSSYKEYSKSTSRPSYKEYSESTSRPSNSANTLTSNRTPTTRTNTANHTSTRGHYSSYSHNRADGCCVFLLLAFLCCFMGILTFQIVEFEVDKFSSYFLNMKP